jgi:hypothetical protein
MANRAGIFEDSGSDFDVSQFAPKTVKEPKPSAEVIRDVSEKAMFKSREPAAATPKPPAKAVTQRRHRTGRNIQMNLKVDAATRESFYAITERQGWVTGETLQHALAALERELAAQGRKS